jgi:hypothetical protein
MGKKNVMEVRTRKGRLDDLVFSDVDTVHLERMTPTAWWLGIYKKNKKGRLTFWIESESKITMEIGERGLPVKFIEQE